MRKWISILLILVGIGCCAVAIYPIIEMNQQVNESLDEWEEIKKQHETTQSTEEVDSSIIGTLKISDFDAIIPLRMGTSEAILKKGIGIDESTVKPGEVGNSVLYGHREQILWNLKDVNVGDVIEVETLDGVLHFSINEINVVDPDDDYIYEQTEEPSITMVTCYPFIYMGPTPERYVVKAVLSVE